ncbi:MAG: CPBP family glutamic-type intramembrane protease [Pseudomonadota bacterium]|jgi:hypothetical protein
MTVADDLEDRPNAGNRSARFIIAAALSPIFFMFWHYNQPQMGFIMMSLAGVFAAALYVKRDLIAKAYFIATIVTLFAIQFSLVIIFRPTTHGYPSIIVLPFAIADLVLVLAIVLGVERLVDRS